MTFEVKKNSSFGSGKSLCLNLDITPLRTTLIPSQISNVGHTMDESPLRKNPNKHMDTQTHTHVPHRQTDWENPR